MKVRRTMTLGLGAALGASGMYLLDPEHGARRRRDALRHGWQRARQAVTEADPGVALRRASALAGRAREGFEAGRGTDLG